MRLDSSHVCYLDGLHRKEASGRRQDERGLVIEGGGRRKGVARVCLLIDITTTRAQQRAGTTGPTGGTTGQASKQTSKQRLPEG